mmetsp:Transcript_2367/g.7839  ORF Transcript_2367/g.7839 Transcript_2367/m.7839 type:complete len:334 (-) Transcript_2367:1634-2635(-)
MLSSPPRLPGSSAPDDDPSSASARDSPGVVEFGGRRWAADLRFDDDSVCANSPATAPLSCAARMPSTDDPSASPADAEPSSRRRRRAAAPAAAKRGLSRRLDSVSPRPAAAASVMPTPVDEPASAPTASSADDAADGSRPVPLDATDASADDVCSTRDASASTSAATDPTASTIVAVRSASPAAAPAAATAVWQTASPLPRANAVSSSEFVRFASAAPRSAVGRTDTDADATADPPSASMATTKTVTFGDPSGKTTFSSDDCRVAACRVLSLPFTRVLKAYWSGASSVTQLCVSSVNWVSSAKPRDGDATSLPEDGGRATKKLMDATPSTEPN